MKRLPPLLVPFATAGLLLAGTALADAPAKATWWIEPAPWTCARFLGSVGRAVQEACDANGGKCALAPAESSANRRLVLFCEERDDGWRVSGEGAAHAPLWGTSFDGEIDERPAKIGWFVAHDGEWPPLAPRLAAAPHKSAVAVVVPVRSSAAPLSFSPQELPPTESENQVEAAEAPQAAEPEKEKEKASKPEGGGAEDRRGGLSLDAFVGLANFKGDVRGAHAVAVAPYGAARVGLAATYATQSGSDESRFTGWLGRAGGVVALGAPWDSHVAGCALEGGVAFGQAAGVGPAPVSPYVSPYVQWTGVLQIPVRPIKPWVGVSTTFVLNQLGDAVQTLTLVGGVAWNAW